MNHNIYDHVSGYFNKGLVNLLCTSVQRTPSAKHYNETYLKAKII